MSYQPPYVNYSNQLSARHRSTLPRRGNRILPAICCPKCSLEGRTVPLIPTVCFGVTTPSNNGKYYWQCPPPCEFFRFLPNSNSDLDRDVISQDPHPPGPPPSYPDDFSNPPLVPMFPSSSPAASPARPVSSHQPPTAFSDVSASMSTLGPASTTQMGKLECSTCGKTANKACRRHSCKTCCEKAGGCEIAAHRRGRMVALAFGMPSQVHSPTPTRATRGGVLHNLIMGSADDYPEVVQFPSSTFTLSSASSIPPANPSIMSTAPPSTLEPIPTPTFPNPVVSAPPSRRNQSYARSLNPTWMRYIDSGKDTRETGTAMLHP
ncbi:hypothetical protein FRB90_006653, partial [Tulasnella sp. 427]